jgi:hypothetical protein
MTAYNVVRMRVKPGRNEDYLEAHRAIDRDTFAGMKSVAIIQTGERDFCLIGEWDSMDAIVAARPTMIATLDRSREMLEDLGGDLGVTDPISATSSLTYTARWPDQAHGRRSSSRAAP